VYFIGQSTLPVSCSSVKLLTSTGEKISHAIERLRRNEAMQSSAFEFQILNWQARSELLEIGTQQIKPEPSQH